MTKYDLEERTINFASRIISVVNTLPKTIENQIFLKQIIRSCTSVGANYLEANGSVTTKDFKNKIAISRKETKETWYWLRMLSKTNINQCDEFEILIKESLELIYIFSSIMKKS